MHTLFGYQGSGSAAVEAALGWLGLPHRVIQAASWAEDSELEALRRVNPLGQIPALQLPDGTVLTESAAILMHLGLSHPQGGLLPADPAARALALRGLVYIASNCYAAIGIIDYPERWLARDDASASEPGDGREPNLPATPHKQGDDAFDALCEQLRRGAKARLALLWEVFADAHTTRPYLHGEQPGALDMLAAVVSKWSGARAHLQRERPDFHATLLRIEQHPRLKPVFERHWPAA
jgi:GST-like protein